MTRKSDRNQDQERPIKSVKDEWLKWKPNKKKCEFTAVERADFHTAIYKAHDVLVRNWIRQFVPTWLQESIDVAQLKIEILNELISEIWSRFDDEVIDANGARLLCWTITNRRSIDSLRKTDCLKRSIPGEFIRLDTVGEVPDRNVLGPDCEAELNDFERVVSNSLDPQKRRVLALKQMNWTNEQIAEAIGVSLSTYEN